MLRRPLLLVVALTLADYLLWRWSLSTGLDAVALVAGVTLPVLIVALGWIAARGLLRSLMLRSPRPRERGSAPAGAGSAGPRTALRPSEGAPAHAARPAEQDSRKLAA